MASVDLREQLGLEPLETLTKYVNALVYGPPNAGKTYLAGTMQDHKDLSPCIHLGFEQGLLTVAYRKDYEAKEIRSIDELEKVVKLLQDDTRSAKPYYKGLIVDNATELQNLDIETVMIDAKKIATGKGRPETVDIDVPSQREWGKIGKRLRRCIIGLRDLPLHTVWTAWRGEYIDDSDITHYFPKLAGHMKNEFSGYFDIVGMLLMDAKKDENGKSIPFTTLQVQETKRVKAKWRNKPEEVPAIIEMPTMPMIWEFVQKSKLGTG